MSYVTVGSLRECWIWNGCTRYGYGLINVDRKCCPAHRVLYELLVGPVPKGLVLDHICHNPKSCGGGASCPHRKCVNPTHLELVTREENTRRGCHKVDCAIAALHRARTHCPKGHEYSTSNTMFDVYGYRKCRICAKEWCRLAYIKRHYGSAA